MSSLKTAQLFFVVVLTVLLVGCQKDPVVLDYQVYHSDMQPILLNNGDLAEEFRDMAALVKRKQVSAGEIGTKLDDRLVPLAEKVVTDARNVTIKLDDLRLAHGELVAVWEERVDCYRAIIAAWKAEDLDAFDGAIQNNFANKRQEELAIAAINDLLMVYSVTRDSDEELQLYPTQPIADP